MIFDKQNALGDQQVVTVTAPTTDYIDQGAAGEPGMNGKLALVLTVDTTFTAAGAATLTAQLQCDSDPGFATALKTVIQTDAIPVATLVAGYQIFLPIPLGLDLRYIRANYVVATGPMLTGKISASVTMGVQKSKAYPDGLTN